MIRKILFTILLLVSDYTFSQTYKPQNLPKYDKQYMHFGMSLGLNTMDFTIRPHKSIYTNDSIFAVENYRLPGFNINIVMNYNIYDKLSLRLLPGLIFGERDLRYVVKNTDTSLSTVLMKIESTFIDFPVLLKYKSDRLNNFRAYLLGGASFKYDLAAKDQIKPEERPMIRLIKPDFYYEVGAGLDFFLEYFKFAIELKLAVGMRNVLVYDDSKFTTTIERMNSKMVILSFLFEGSDLSNFNIFTRKK
jgi:hypothetical protein